MKIQSSFAMLIACVLSSNAHAAVFCQGTVARVGVQPDGVVAMYAPAIAADVVYLCQIGGTSNGISSDACKAVLATLMSAKSQGTTVQWAFNDSVSCGQRPVWSYLWRAASPVPGRSFEALGASQGQPQSCLGEGRAGRRTSGESW